MYQLNIIILKTFTWKYSNIPTASTTPIDKPILNTTNINV